MIRKPEKWAAVFLTAAAHHNFPLASGKKYVILVLRQK